MTVVAYRHAAYDSPWWVFPSARAGRFNRAFEAEPTQYLALHPLGPTAELLRHQFRGPDADLADTILANLWAVRIDPEEPLVDITFDSCAAEFGIGPGELVGDDYEPTQALAARLREAGVEGFIAPSAALPGTENAVLFGSRVAHPYLAEPTTPEECATGHLTDGARSAREVIALVRFMGSPHAALETWLATGRYEKLDDPLPDRW